MKTTISTLCLYLVVNLTLSAQYQIGLVPRISPDRMVAQKVGYTSIELNYGSPFVKGRTIWGDLVPYDYVWRAGANNATTISFSTDVEVEGHPLAKGKYALFILPREHKKWIVIFSKKAEQWGAFSYQEAEDALRIEVLPTRSTNWQEALFYSIRNYGPEYACVNLHWERLNISFRVSTKYLNQFKAKLEARISQAEPNLHWVIYLQGAAYLEKNGEALAQAQTWIEKSEALMDRPGTWNKQFYPKAYIKGHLYWVKAKLLARQEAYVAALDYVEKLKQIETNYSYYQRKKEIEDIDAYVEAWEREKD